MNENKVSLAHAVGIPKLKLGYWPCCRFNEQELKLVEKIEKAGGTVMLREARRIDKSQTDVASSQAAPDAAVATDKRRVKKTKTRNKKSE